VFVVLGIQRAMRMRRIILSPVASPLYHIFSHYLTIRHDFRKKKLLNTKCVFWFYLQFFCMWNISHSNNNWARYDQKCKLVCVWIIRYSCHMVMELEIFSTDFRKILKYQISWKSVEWGLNFPMRTYGRTIKEIHCICFIWF